MKHLIRIDIGTNGKKRKGRAKVTQRKSTRRGQMKENYRRGSATRLAIKRTGHVGDHMNRLVGFRKIRTSGNIVKEILTQREVGECPRAGFQHDRHTWLGKPESA